jgi:mono/diheme cytochrome c family protein
MARRPSASVVFAAILVALALPAGTARAIVHPGAASGALLYQRECAPCHGPTGRGDGPEGIYFAPPPRDLHEGFLARYPTGELVERIRRGRQLMIEIDPQATKRRAQMVEQIVVHVERLPDVDWDRVEQGAEIYAQRCEACHGPFGRPAPGMPLPPGVQRAPRDLSARDFQKSVSDQELSEVARHGRDGMPAIPPLASEQETKALLAYLRLLSPGFELYSLWCAGCHGDDGKGEGVYATGDERPGVVFDRAYLKAQDPETLRRNVFHMLEWAEPAMPHFERALSEAQTRAIIEYLRATEPPPASPGGSPAASPSGGPTPRR